MFGRTKYLAWYMTFVALAIGVSSAHAETITGVTIEDFSSEVINLVPRDAVFTIDGSGFDEVNGFHSTAANNTMWTTAGNIAGEPGSPDPLPVHITFDLEDNYVLSSLKVWNFNDATALTAGAKDATISVADSEGGAFTSLDSFVFDPAPGNAAVDFGQVIDLSSFPAAENARLVRFDITTNYGFTHAGAALVGLSEVRFDGVVVPEPSAVVLSCMGLFGLTLCGRHRRRH